MSLNVSMNKDELLHPKTASKEFVILMALMTSLMALSIDAILPAMDSIRHDLAIQKANQSQFIISFIFLGFGVGQLLFGPLSDSYGRKLPIYVGGVIYAIGCLISSTASDLDIMLIGRGLQGFGVASFRTISIAIVRDQFKGIAMAKVMSVIMSIFIMVPVMAPAFGQFVLLFSNWRTLFVIFILLTIIIEIWFVLRQEETLVKERRNDFSLKVIWNGVKETSLHPVSASSTIMSGLVFGGLIAYISSAQQIFQNIYLVGKLFPLFFGSLALTVGISSFLNSKLVSKWGLVNLISLALKTMTVTSIIFATYLLILKITVPALWLLMIYFAIFFFCLGLLFGNLNSLALQPLGHIAGVASSVVGSIQNFIAVFIGTIIASQFSTNLIPIILGFTGLSTVSYLFLLVFIRLKIYQDLERLP
jgi:DHA1 family bicyclomycin/chloramphenicol resistance-like MFS transporter